MPAFRVARRRKRHRQINTIRLIAIDFDVHERTLRRWIARAELRRVLRAYQHGKQTRLHVPETDAEFERYKQEVLSAVRPFRRKRVGRVSPWVRQTAERLGYGNKQRERDLLKIQIISAKYGCPVFDVPKYLDGWIAEDPTRERKNTARRIRQSWPTTAQLNKASGVWKAQWLERTLIAAARGCIDDGKRISGPNLAPRLFHNFCREHAWKTNEKRKQQLPNDHLWLDPHGQQGISLSLFRQRYDLKDIQKATRVAEGMTQSEQMEK
jgi:hypothetical protein